MVEPVSNESGNRNYRSSCHKNCTIGNGRQYDKANPPSPFPEINLIMITDLFLLASGRPPLCAPDRKPSQLLTPTVRIGARKGAGGQLKGPSRHVGLMPTCRRTVKWSGDDFTWDVVDEDRQHGAVAYRGQYVGTPHGGLLLRSAPKGRD
jgi:hypothetical protein